jgi:hypothetical protein
MGMGNFICHPKEGLQIEDENRVPRGMFVPKRGDRTGG